MSSGPENTFITSVHRHLPKSLYRMKNHNQYNGGIADVWYSGKKADQWIEYKFIVVPKRDGTVIDLINRPLKGDSVISSLQQDWLGKRHAEGRNVGVIVGSKDGGVWFPGLSWNMLYTADDFKQRLNTRQDLAGIIARFTL
jgi:hypothetical protein